MRPQNTSYGDSHSGDGGGDTTAAGSIDYVAAQRDNLHQGVMVSTDMGYADAGPGGGGTGGRGGTEEDEPTTETADSDYLS
eukprot:7995932-Alexandrium_andersonii.AAC.1